MSPRFTSKKHHGLPVTPGSQDRGMDALRASRRDQLHLHLAFQASRTVRLHTPVGSSPPGCGDLSHLSQDTGTELRPTRALREVSRPTQSASPSPGPSWARPCTSAQGARWSPAQAPGSRRYAQGLPSRGDAGDTRVSPVSSEGLGQLPSPVKHLATTMGTKKADRDGTGPWAVAAVAL